MKQKVIGVLGPSGGIGKSTIAKELAITISSTKINDSNIKTCLIDANLVFGSQKAFFKILPKYTIIDWVKDYRSVRDILTFREIEARYNWNCIEKYLSYAKEYNTYLLPAPSNGEYFEINLDEMQIIIYILRIFFDVIIIDTGNNLSSATMSTMRLADEALLIVNDESRTIESVKKLRKTLRIEDIPLDKFKVVINRYPEKSKNRLYSKTDIEEVLYINVCAVLPEDKNTWMLNNSAIPIITYKDKNKLKKELLKLAHLLVPEVNPKQFQFKRR